MSELSAFVRFLHLTAAVFLTGSFAFVLLTARPAYLRSNADQEADYFSFLRSQFRLARCYVVIIAATALMGLWLQSRAVSAVPTPSLFDGGAVFPLLTETEYGRVWLARMILLTMIAVLLLFAKQRSAGSNSLAIIGAGFTLSACLISSLALTGHAAAADDFAFALQASADGLHLLASGIWLGGLVPLAALLRQCSHRQARADSTVAGEATRRFSLIGLLSVIVLVTTGSYNSWILVGSFPALFGTPYGNLLLVKLTLLLPLLGFAAVNRSKLKPKLVAALQIRTEESGAPVRKLTRNVIGETMLGIAILLIVGHMGVTPPGKHVQPQWPFSFRWDWSILDQAPKTQAEVERGVIWAAVGVIAFGSAFVRRRRRILGAAIGVAAFGYAINVMHSAISTDAYPTTYKRPAVTYHAISVANGMAMYQESGCVVCHGPAGYGDGPAAVELKPKPPDLTAQHANAHTAGDLFWWLSYGVNQSTAMPGFSESLSEEERWDLINYLRALSSGEKARSLAPVIEEKPWLVAPDFSYETNAGESKTLKDHRGNKIVLLVLLSLNDTEERVQQLGGALPKLRSAGVEIIAVPNPIDYALVADKLPGLIVNEGIREITETYNLFARSFADENLVAAARHAEFLIDKQGYIRARWLPTEGSAWGEIAGLMSQIELLKKEKPRAPAPDDHVH